MKERLIQFMQGRYGAYGADAFTKFLMGAAVVFMVLSVFTDVRGSSLLVILLLIYAYFRLLSKNYAKRQAENQAYLRYTYSLRQKLGRQKSMMGLKKGHHIYKCPSCRQKVRVPKGKGKIAVRCPKCKTEFIKRS